MTHPLLARRAAATLALPALVALLSCSGPAEPASGPAEGVFLLRTVAMGSTGVGERRAVPFDITYTNPNYTRRYSGGVFALEPGRQWRSITRMELLIDGVLIEERGYEETGRYEIVERRADGYLLNLLPDLVTEQSPYAVIRGDSLITEMHVYVR